jgi:hypothetical protein
MKKYRLIKLYPGIDSFGFVGMQVSFDNAIKMYVPLILNKRGITKQAVENWPEYWEEIKEPLFVTEDGVELFNINDRVFGVLTKANWQKYYNGDGVYLGIIINKKSSDWKYFSTKEAAEKYYDLNIPKYSKKQILDTLYQCKEHYYGYFNSKEFTKLLEI